MTTELFQPSFEDVLASLPGSERFLDFRKAQMAAFRSTGLPTLRDEDWRYTNLARIGRGGFVTSEPNARRDAELADQLAAASLQLGDCHRLVFIDGSIARDLSQIPDDAGLTVASLADALSGGNQAPALGLDAEQSVFAALNAAWLRDGALIRVAAGAKITKPIYLLFFGQAAQNLALHPRVLLHLGDSAEAEVVIHHTATTGARGWLNTVLEAELNQGASLSLSCLQENSGEQTHTSINRLILGRDAQVRMRTVDFGSALVRHDIAVELAQPGAAVDLCGLFFPRAGQHMDVHTRIDHLAPETRSDEAYRGMAGERGRGVFNGKVVVHPDAQRIDARQSSNNLLLGERCEIDTKPELEIYADDVKCSHGATVGELDHDALFYLLSRGLSEGTARALLTYAFANEVIAKLQPAPLREHVARSLLGAIPETGLSAELAEVLK